MGNIKVIQVIHVTSRKREGTVKDIARLIHEYWGFDGELLAVNDPCIKEEISKQGCGKKFKNGFEDGFICNAEE